jgi:hypothetical protein
MSADSPEAQLVPAAEPDQAAYEADFYTWAFEQARLLREGGWEALDRENVAEEIESLGREQYAKLRSAIRVLLMHMLKWDFQPERRSRSWALTISAQRVDLEDVLEGNTGLKPRIEVAMREAYRRARIEAALETGLELGPFPAECPYSWADITQREFSA